MFSLVEIIKTDKGISTLLLYKFKNRQNAIYVKNAFEKVFKGTKKFDVFDNGFDN